MFPEEKLGSEFLFSLSTHKIYLGYLFFLSLCKSENNVNNHKNDR